MDKKSMRGIVNKFLTILCLNIALICYPSLSDGHPVLSPSRHQPLLPLGWAVDGASCKASVNCAREYIKALEG